MNGKFEAFAAGAIVGRASAQRSRRRAMTRKRDPLDALGPSQRRIALLFGQIVGTLTAAVFFGYEIYVFCVLS
jgi:hypothetical protein